ncbi:MATE family efflux transporter [Youxingia wuxianensis]|uniref:MATE family efflux transporter n=1 Tax=Youxingia wuxianensis TaxID=2763678 RepID=A0A926IDC6_9FIRM|nr:MATE family efflux transporter [Youxingia wuxianensis]MBC8586152.1 MATE family efflux transporter [Youxingia wuxianensis]
MKLFVRDGTFYKTLVAIAAPVALQNLITFMVSMMDTIMIGALGEVQLSATSIANQLWFILMEICFGVAGGANVISAQYWGKGDVGIIRRIQSITYKTLLVVSVLCSCIALFLPGQFMSVFTTDQGVIEYGIQYLQIIGFSYPLYALASAGIMQLRSIGTVKISVVVYLTSLVVNTFLNWVLIFGNLGAPRMEVRGGALATCVARMFEFGIVTFYVFKVEDKVKFGLKDLRANNRHLYKMYVSQVVPVTCNEMLWVVGSTMVSIVIGRMGTQFVAANSIYSVLNQLVMVSIFGVGSATATIIGNTIGTGEYEMAKERSVTFMVIGALLGVIGTLLTLALGPVMLILYQNIPEATKTLVSQLTVVGSIIVFFQAMAVVSMMGVLRAGGDNKFVLVADVIFMWCISIPLGFLTGFKLGWTPPAVYAVLKCDEVLKTLISAVRVFRFRWLQDITLR